MNNFFSEVTLDKIKKNESDVTKKNNFLKTDEIKTLLNYLRNLKNKSVGKSMSVDREESTKIFLDFDQSDF